jgi:hypothetical protein
VANRFWLRNHRLEIDILLTRYPGLRLLPVVDDRVRIGGTLLFTADTKGFEPIQDAFDVLISVPETFPAKLPAVKETEGRVPNSFHTNPDGTLCLGSPTRQRLCLVERPTVLAFVEHCVIPYFYNFVHYLKFGILPFGELPHGWEGIFADYAAMFEVLNIPAIVELVRLASLKKRVANKQACPCDSRQRLGKCRHHLKVNGYRDQLGRGWFREEYRSLAEHQRFAST